jgi:hypothetical protein
VPVVSFDDPQGFPDIKMVIDQGVEVYNPSGSLVFTEQLQCGEGKCTGRWNEYDNNLWCRSAVGYSMRFQVEDKTGNRSIPVEISIVGEVPAL